MSYDVEFLGMMETFRKWLKELEARVEKLEPSKPSPKRYRDVTAECVESSCEHNGSEYSVMEHGYWGLRVNVGAGYRLRKVTVPTNMEPMHAFIVVKEEA